MLKSRDDLIDYCFHQLGAPVIQVEVEEQQVNYCIDTAIERWQDVHCDGTVRRFIPHMLNSDDIDQGYITVPDKIISIIRVMPLMHGTMSTDLNGMGMFNPVYQFRLNDFWDLSRGGLSIYNDVMTNLQMVQDMLQPEIGIAFNRHSNRMYMEVDMQKNATWRTPGKIIVVECFTLLDEDEAPKLYNDWWLKRYATALIKKQWGTNTKKYDGVLLPGGITLNGSQIYNEARQEIAELDQELHDEWSAPPIFMVG